MPLSIDFLISRRRLTLDLRFLLIFFVAVRLVAWVTGAAAAFVVVGAGAFAAGVAAGAGALVAGVGAGEDGAVVG
ncbi:MAG: hypothetical protein ACRECL_06725, partial [Bradyrhizobium sp.]